MAFFKEKMPAEKLAFMLLIYSVQGNWDTDDGHSFAMGPELWPRSEDSKEDPFLRQMEICFLRGWAMFFVLGHLVPEKILEAVMERYASLWGSTWGDKYGRLLRGQWETAQKLYGFQWIIEDLKAGRNVFGPTDLSDQGVQRLIDAVSSEFADYCDLEKVYSEAGRASLKREGRQVLENSLAEAATFIPHITNKYKLVV
jgi:hypothetical protein